jgi:hypothetical protein
LCLSPQFFPEHHFRIAPADGRKDRGWKECIAWLNLASLTSSLILISAITLAALVLVPWPPIREIWTWYLRCALAILVLFMAFVSTTNMRQQLMKTWFGRKCLGPLLSFIAYLYSLLNLLLLGLVLFFFVSALRAARTAAGSEFESLLLIVSVAVWAIFTLLFAIPVAIPEVRAWLVDRQLLQRWPRPLFGWSLFGAAWANLLQTRRQCASMSNPAASIATRAVATP